MAPPISCTSPSLRVVGATLLPVVKANLCPAATAPSTVTYPGLTSMVPAPAIVEVNVSEV